MIEVGIIDYGAGNIASVVQAVEYTGYDATIVHEPEDLLKCERLILPGVGAASQALESMKMTCLDEAVSEAVKIRGVPLLGICLGMQIMADKLHEFGEHEGLGLIPGEVVRIEEITNQVVHVPHMGWNKVVFTGDGKYFGSHVGSRSEFYFAHSYTFKVNNNNHIAALVDYPDPLVAAVLSNNIFATQFHPEKSQIAGQNLISAFLDWSP